MSAETLGVSTQILFRVVQGFVLEGPSTRDVSLQDQQSAHGWVAYTGLPLSPANFSSKSKRKNRRKSNGRRIEDPRPMITDANPVFFRRFTLVNQTGASSDLAFSVAGLLDMLGGVCADATTAYAVSYAMKLKRVQLWGSAPSSGGVSTAAIDWVATQQNSSPQKIVSDVSTSVDHVPYISTRPSPNTLGAFWYNYETSVVLFRVTTSGQAIMVIDVDFVLNDGTPVSKTVAYNTISTSGRVAGDFVYGSPAANWVVWGLINA
jgi:hypothetical protein